MQMTAVAVVWAEQQEAQVYLSGADSLTYPTESVIYHTLVGFAEDLLVNAQGLGVQMPHGTP
jgi:hypothetical protein